MALPFSSALPGGGGAGLLPGGPPPGGAPSIGGLLAGLAAQHGAPASLTIHPSGMGSGMPGGMPGGGGGGPPAMPSIAGAPSPGLGAPGMGPPAAKGPPGIPSGGPGGPTSPFLKEEAGAPARLNRPPAPRPKVPVRGIRIKSAPVRVS